MTKEDRNSLNLELDGDDVDPNNDKNDKLNPTKATSEVVYRPSNTMNESRNATMKFELMKEESEEPKHDDPLFLYATAFTANLLIFAVGIGFSWTSPVLPKLHGPESPLGFSVNASQESWITTFMSLGATVGPLVAGKLADRLGRKKTLLLLAYPILIAFFILAFATNLYLYYLARFLHGVSVGSTLAVLPMYLGEITEDHNRGKYGCILGIFITLGILFSFVVGPMFNIRTFCLTCTFPLFIFLIVFSLFMPETPHYLLSIKNRNGAEEALMALRNKDSSEVQKELNELSKSVENESGNEGGISNIFSSPGVRKAFIVTCGLVVFQQMSGINAVMGYLETIFDATGSAIPPNISAVLIGAIQVVTNFLAVLVVEKLGRKVLLLASTIGAASSILLLGTYFFLQRHHFNLSFCWWLPISCLLVYIVAFNLGIGPLPWTIASEVYPSNVKSTAISLTASICFLASAGITLGFPLISQILGMAECFWMFGLFLSLAIIFIYFIVPETKGRSLSEIQEMLSGRSSNA